MSSANIVYCPSEAIRTCPLCGLEKNEADFSKNAEMVDGLAKQCRKCLRNRRQELRLAAGLPVQTVKSGIKRDNSIEAMKAWAVSLGGVCLSDVYTKSKDNYRWRCDKGHEWNATWGNVGGVGTWCRKCRMKVHETRESKERARKETVRRFLDKPGQFERRQERYKIRKQSDPLLLRRGTLAKYGLDLDSFDKLLGEQNGLCGLCKRPFLDDTFYRVIDHDHDTGNVRGIIHRSCNTALGAFEDSLELLKMAVLYLEKPCVSLD